MPGYKVRQMIEEYDDKQRSEHKGRLSFEEFEKLCKELKANELGSTFKQVVSKKENLETLGGISTASSEGTTHSVRLEEQLAFSDWINTNLSHDPDLKHLLPIDAEGKTLYDKVKDGILLWYVEHLYSQYLLVTHPLCRLVINNLHLVPVKSSITPARTPSTKERSTRRTWPCTRSTRTWP